MPKEDFMWHMYEGYLSQVLSELNFPGGAKNYLPVQLMVLFLFAHGDPTRMSPAEFLKVAKAFPNAVEQIMGSREALDTLNVPQMTPADKSRFPQIWESVEPAAKEKIISIYNAVKQMVGA
jgi:hypothetical protein